MPFRLLGTVRAEINVKAGGKNFRLPVFAVPFDNTDNRDGGVPTWRQKPLRLSRGDIRPADMQHAWRGPNDLSARWNWGWSKRGIQILMTVKDDKHVPVEKLRSLWRGDSIQIGIDLSQTGPSAAATCELGFSVDQKDRPGVWHYSGRQPTGDEIVYRATRDGRRKETHYDILIKWDFLGGFEPAPGKSIYMSVMANENDGAGRKSYMALSDGIGGTHLPHLYPALIMR